MWHNGQLQVLVFKEQLLGGVLSHVATVFVLMGAVSEGRMQGLAAWTGGGTGPGVAEVWSCSSVTFEQTRTGCLLP